MDLFLNLMKYPQKFPNIYFCEIFELRSLEDTQKINKWLSSFILCDNASLRLKAYKWYLTTVSLFACFQLKSRVNCTPGIEDLSQNERTMYTSIILLGIVRVFREPCCQCPFLLAASSWSESPFLNLDRLLLYRTVPVLFLPWKLRTNSSKLRDSYSVSNYVVSSWTDVRRRFSVKLLGLKSWFGETVCVFVEKSLLIEFSAWDWVSARTVRLRPLHRRAGTPSRGLEVAHLHRSDGVRGEALLWGPGAPPADASDAEPGAGSKPGPPRRQRGCSSPARI